MVGITLSAEQIQAAPPEVRRWIEEQIGDLLGLRRIPPPIEAGRHLVGCSAAEIRSVLDQLQTSLPLVSVLFELAREPAWVTPQGMHVLQLDDMTRHCRLQNTDQVAACLEQINRVLRAVTGNDQAMMTVLDQAGHCIVEASTVSSIMSVWQAILSAAHGPAYAAPVVAGAEHAPEQPAAVLPHAISVPSSAVTMGPAPT